MFAEGDELRPTRIFSDRSLVGPGEPCAMLAPFWGGHESDPRDPLYGRFDAYRRIASSLFELTELQRAEFAILPFDFGHILDGRRAISEARNFIHRVVEAGKKTIVFCWHDSSEPLDLPVHDTIVFRTAIDRSRQAENEHCLPTFNEDFVAKYLNGELPIRKKHAVPSVSFCGRGQQKGTLSQEVRSQLRRIRYRFSAKSLGFPYGKLRSRAMAALERARGIDCHFVTFTKFWGDLGDNAACADTDSRIAARKQYLQNMLQSDYVLCVRGAGNFSMRLYETLCLGRIPLIVDTESVFPFDDTLAWGEFSVKVPSSDVNSLGHTLVEFHNGLSDANFGELQRCCRQAWLSHLSPHGFYKTLNERCLQRQMC